MLRKARLSLSSMTSYSVPFSNNVISKIQQNKNINKDKITALYLIVFKNQYNNDAIYIGESEDVIKRIKQHLIEYSDNRK